MTNKETILEVKGISKKYPGVQALSDVSLDVRRGEVLSLVGENGAGKSTLMKILLGEESPSSGEMFFKGKPHAPKSPNDALLAGISMIHQELSLIPYTSVAENIWIGREERFSRNGLLNMRTRRKMTEDLLQKYGIPINPEDQVTTLTVAKKQLVEIARAISYESDIIIMDEPTSSLTAAEIQILLNIIKKLTDKGVSIIFISHKLDEVLDISDRISVLRDGHSVGTCDAEGIDEQRLMQMIVGREIKEMFPKMEADIGKIALEVRNLSSQGMFRDVSFHVRKGEIVGFSGLVGAGRTEVMRAIFGVDKYDDGEILIDETPVKIKTSVDAISHGMGMVTEDRRGIGIFSLLSVAMNIGMAALPKFCKYNWIRKKEELEAETDIIRRMDIKVSSPRQVISTLSGGNQQKALIGRWLLTDTKILILDEPTRGIDVGSKSEIHRQISALAQKGMAVILISSELPEVMGMSDRIYVMRNGRIVSEVNRKDFSQENLMNSAFGINTVADA